MKLAFVTDDGIAISAHFGRAGAYLVVSLENGREVGRELRPKLGHSHFNGESHPETSEGGRHGFDAAAESRHGRMMEAISDCQVLVGRGMGSGAFGSLQARHIQPILTELAGIDEALTAYLEGKLVHHPERLH